MKTKWNNRKVTDFLTSMISLCILVNAVLSLLIACRVIPGHVGITFGSFCMVLSVLNLTLIYSGKVRRMYDKNSK